MQTKLFLTYCLVILAMLTQIQAKKKDLLTFKQFKIKFNKSYGSPEEEGQRKEIFKANRKQIQQKVNCTACGTTQFSDLTQEQFQKQKLTLQSAQIQPSLLRQQVIVQGAPSLEKTPVQVGVTPQSLDWRDFNGVSDVRDQKSCGSCWSFAVTAGTESYAIVNDLSDNKINLAEQFLLQCTNGSSCDGGYIQRAMDVVIAKKGMPFETAYPYNYTTLYGSSKICSAKVDFPSPAKRRFTKYGIQDAQIIEYLQRSPVAIALSATGWGSYSPSKQNVFSCSSSVSVNHAVLLVGYTPEYWIVKNSWGTWWGANGYIYINKDRTSNKNCKIGNSVHVFAQECGLTNCQLCEIGRVSCEICAPGYYQEYVSDSYDYLCLPCKDPNCQTCYHTRYADNIVGTCSVCKIGWAMDYWGTGLCKKIDITNCQMYWVSNFINLCYSCDIGYVRTTNYRTCLKCQVSNCYECKRDTLDKCDTCIEGYTGADCHFECVENCATKCSTTFKCDRCLDGYTGDDCSEIECDMKNCDDGCTKPNICDKCAVGYTGDKCQTIIEGTCQIDNCKACNVGGATCLTCEDGYSGSTCQTIACGISHCSFGCITPNVCARCDDGWSGDQCAVATCNVNKCTSCSTPNVCAICNPGYSGNSCQTLDCDISKCNKCVKPNICKRCASGYSGDKCENIKCTISNCQAGCSTPNICSNCDIGWKGNKCNKADKSVVPKKASAGAGDSSSDEDTQKDETITQLKSALIAVSIVGFLCLVTILVIALCLVKKKRQSEQINNPSILINGPCSSASGMKIDYLGNQTKSMTESSGVQ